MRNNLPLPRSGQDFRRNQKRYGWFRLYNDFVGHPKWRLVAVRSGVHLGFVHTIVLAICTAASKARARGFIGDLEFDVLAAATDIPADNIAATFRTLADIGWISQDHITDWLDRQPDAEDPTATERQRQKRARDRAKRAVAMGNAKPEDLELLSAVEREALTRLAQSSRVTASPPAPPPAPEATAFTGEGEGAARVWLLGTAGGAGYGPASKLVADNYGVNRLNADGTIRRWLNNYMAGEAETLARIISGAYEQALTNERFRNVVESRITEFARARTAGPSLPFGPIAVNGGRTT